MSRQGKGDNPLLLDFLTPFTAPMHTPTNASPRHHWSSTHSSGPERVATPYPVVDFHHLPHAGFCRRFPSVPLYGKAVIHSIYLNRGAENRQVLLINRQELFNIVNNVPQVLIFIRRLCGGLAGCFR